MLALHLGTAAALGLASSLHCVAMCGPLAASACAERGAGDAGAARLASSYVFGRVVGYAAMGALAGLAAAPWLGGVASAYVRAAAGVLVGLTLLRSALRWLLPPPEPRSITLGRGPAALGRAPDPSWLTALSSYLPSRGLGLGLVTALFPCGTLLSGLLAAAASGSAAVGAAMMVVFALTTSPALLAAMMLGGRLTRSLGARAGGAKRALGTAALILAAWTMAAPLSALAKTSDGEGACDGR